MATCQWSFTIKNINYVTMQQPIKVLCWKIQLDKAVMHEQKINKICEIFYTLKLNRMQWLKTELIIRSITVRLT